MSDRLPAGRIGRPHGLRGEVTVLPDDPAHFAPGTVMIADDGRELIVRSSRSYRDRGLVVGFEGVDDRTAAERLRGTIATVAASDLTTLEPGEWWFGDLIGLQAVDEHGATLGEVVDVIEGPQDRLVVLAPGGARVEVPFVADLVDDPDDGRIVIRPPAGLFPESG